ncbi:acyltransferase family protein [Serratia proteamaculans]|uniref:acyltransferase family protein n=1 Tax=Serratia proteamaculans TaxID=28151 RepID=UPI0039B090D4
MNHRKIEIDTLRGLACLLLVIHHSIEGYFKAGMLNNSSFLVEFSIALKYLRMPLFTFLSGYVYSLHPVEYSGVKRFFIAKFRRLGLPIIFIGLPLAFLQAIFGTGEHLSLVDAALSPIIPKTLFWYLNALILIFFITAFLELSGMLKTKLLAFISLCISLIVFVSPLRDINILGIGGACYLLPFFLWGIIVSRFLNDLSIGMSNFIKLCFVATFAYICWQVGNGEISYSDVMEINVVPALLSLVLCIGIYSFKMRSGFLASIGVFSYTIYLYHSLAAPALRIAISGLVGKDFFDNGSVVVVFVIVGAILGVIMPIVVHKIFSKNFYTSLLFLGIKLKYQHKEIATKTV